MGKLYAIGVDHSSKDGDATVVVERLANGHLRIVSMRHTPPKPREEVRGSTADVLYLDDERGELQR